MMPGHQVKFAYAYPGLRKSRSTRSLGIAIIVRAGAVEWGGGDPCGRPRELPPGNNIGIAIIVRAGAVEWGGGDPCGRPRELPRTPGEMRSVHTRWWGPLRSPS